MRNTLITTFGFVQAWLSRRLPGFGKTPESVEGIYNYLYIDGLYATSGQPSEQEFELIQQQGYDLVINLAPESVLENALVEEASILSRLAIDYVHLPVNFQKPSERKFQMFVDCLNRNSDKKVWVHCAANMRVSAFTYRYRVQELGIPEAKASRDLQKIWDPFGVWKQFVQRAQKNPN